MIKVGFPYKLDHRVVPYKAQAIYRRTDHLDLEGERSWYFRARSSAQARLCGRHVLHMAIQIRRNGCLRYQEVEGTRGKERQAQVIIR